MNRKPVALVALAAALATAPLAAAPNPSAATPGAGMGGFRTAQPAWLGVSMQPDPAGVLATQIIPGSPADRAGLLPGDRLKKIAGVPVAQPSDVQRAVASRVAGDVIAVTLDRKGQELVLKVELAERPSADAVARATYVGKAAPNLVGLVSVNGPALSTEALHDRVVVVDFWAVWCGPCRLSMPALSALQARYGAQGLTVLSITTDSVDRAAAFARDLGLRTTVAVDKDGETSRLYGVSVLPTTFVVDRRGVVRDVTLGYDRSEEPRLEATVRDLLAEPSAARTATSDAGAGPARRAADAGK